MVSKEFDLNANKKNALTNGRELNLLGIGCRFAGGVRDPASFWELLKSQGTAIGEIPDTRFDPTCFLGSTGETGRSVTFRGGWLDQIDHFDAKRFHISPREAREMDPQQRLFLEVALEALHDAGMNPDNLSDRRVGVFVGTGTAEYQAMAFSSVDDISPYTMSGNSLALIANRLSYFLDLDGPSLAVDTACSASMTAFCLACDSLKSGQCDLAIVGGTNVMLGPSPFIGFSQSRMLSPRGICAPFDASADGFVRGEGCGAVIIARGDTELPLPSRIYATIAACGMNEDGRTASLTIPNEARQRALYAESLARAGLAPEDIVYVEAHGTGTQVGDPIEARSLSAQTVKLFYKPSGRATMRFLLNNLGWLPAGPQLFCQNGVYGWPEPLMHQVRGIGSAPRPVPASPGHCLCLAVRVVTLPKWGRLSILGLKGSERPCTKP